ncbi:hypothetical protein MAHJHV30_18100 [Mycobacterium avium subsp. hominissuis]
MGNDLSADDGYRQRFVREADLAAELWHPNIVRVNDRGEFNGQLWISMDFVDGTDAATLLQDRYPSGMPADEVATIIVAIASALDYAHRQNLLHRDVKPANILLANPGEGERRILLGDFGIARTTGDAGGLTATNMTIGTLPYAAPEQLTDEPIDGRADQYALAATAYHLLTGTTLFPHTNPAVVISRHLSAPPPALADTRPDLAPLDSVLAVALAKEPADRFASCTDFARVFATTADSSGHAKALASTLQAPLSSRPSTSSGVPSTQGEAGNQQPRRRRRILITAASTLVVIAAIGAIGYVVETKATISKPNPPAAVLDGSYRVNWDFTKRTNNGAPAPITKPADAPADNAAWWAFRSSCTQTGCVATGTLLDLKNHQVASTPLHTAELHFVNGHWLRTPVKAKEAGSRCLGADNKIVPGEYTEVVIWALEPQPDNSLKGQATVTPVTNECGMAGAVFQTPLTLTRVGDTPATVTVADPATVATIPTPISPIPDVSGVTPALNGTYQVVFDWTKQTVNGEPTIGPGESETAWWAFRSLCTSAGCVATGAELAKENQQLAVGGGSVFHFVDGHWQNEPELVDPSPCPAGTTKAQKSSTATWSWTPLPNGTLQGIATATILTNECGTQGKVYRTPLSITRVGDVPPTVVLADPALFIAPTAPPSDSHP